MRTLVNPVIEPCDFARQVAAEIAANGGSLTAEEWEFTAHYEGFGTCWSRTQALGMAKERGGAAIVGVPGCWKVYRAREDVGHDHV